MEQTRTGNEDGEGSSVNDTFEPHQYQLEIVFMDGLTETHKVGYHECWNSVLYGYETYVSRSNATVGRGQVGAWPLANIRRWRKITTTGGTR